MGSDVTYNNKISILKDFTQKKNGFDVTEKRENVEFFFSVQAKIFTFYYVELCTVFWEKLNLNLATGTDSLMTSWKIDVVMDIENSFRIPLLIFSGHERLRFNEFKYICLLIYDFKLIISQPSFKLSRPLFLYKKTVKCFSMTKECFSLKRQF